MHEPALGWGKTPSLREGALHLTPIDEQQSIGVRWVIARSTAKHRERAHGRFQILFDGFNQRGVDDDRFFAVRLRFPADELVERGLRILVETGAEFGWHFARRQVARQCDAYFRQELVDEPAGQRFCLIDENELLTLGGDVVGDEGDNGDGKVLVLGARQSK